MKLKKPYYLIWISALFVLVFRLMYYKDEDVIDINIHDTYFVIDHLAITYITFIGLFIIGLIYFLLYKYKISLLKPLVFIHIIVTTISVLVSQIGLFFLTPKESPFDFTFSLIDFLNLITTIGILVQPIFILNSFFSLIRHFLKK
ncbi:hypothetical protein [Seonamhaeicola marinus]|uniref:Uncharacterized protein n=1 Tax=Seonamhaeicola marinus TaxID=1912246 RepID=A0A5D0I884_9FLAO|nr:hypothetical protein [Seonamhaeicola marinus]TYA78637.1 hypothetical protein FUA24_09805 [Seonamhaeicola marinus]